MKNKAEQLIKQYRDTYLSEQKQNWLKQQPDWVQKTAAKIYRLLEQPSGPSALAGACILVPILVGIVTASLLTPVIGTLIGGIAFGGGWIGATIYENNMWDAADKKLKQDAENGTLALRAATDACSVISEYTTLGKEMPQDFVSKFNTVVSAYQQEQKNKAVQNNTQSSKPGASV